MPGTVKTILRFAALCLLLGASPLRAAETGLAIIAHPGNRLTGITQEEVVRIYLGKTNAFPDGAPVRAVDQRLASPSREKFYAQVVKKTNSEITAYWSKLMFTGMATPPNVLNDDAAVKAWVASHPEGLGYVDSKVVDASVKVLLTVP
ncbi:MAG TPA: phosphate ABC transporter substrate-binding protein [Candidatus Methylomirabilis sp.]|nr:phosphate ABC transporter substrate-binding protein [Candidatus Methylomirabilis sp.]